MFYNIRQPNGTRCKSAFIDGKRKLDFNEALQRDHNGQKKKKKTTAVPRNCGIRLNMLTFIHFKRIECIIFTTIYFIRVNVRLYAQNVKPKL